jgi:tetratricopeptide (TPR) repeat protein
MIPPKGPMTLKPRTFRRIVLAGSLTTVVLLVALTYFVVRPWQAQRKLDSMRVNGLAAAQAGDHVEATKLLGRYINRADDPEPETLLAFSRSRLKYQTSDDGHIRVAIRSYRSYLSEVPGDVEAAKDLLPLFNSIGMYVEARNLAESLRTERGDSSIEVVREELLARILLNDNGESLEELFVLTIDNQSAGFADLLEYAKWLKEQGRMDDAKAMFASEDDSNQRNFNNQLVSFWLGIDSQSLQLDRLEAQPFVIELCSILGLDPGEYGDPETIKWLESPEFLSAESARLATIYLNSFRRPDLSLQVQLASAQKNKDRTSILWSARRLYWNQDFETLNALGVHDENGDSVPDVLGYQILASQQNGDESRTESLLAALDNIVLDFRAKAWHEFIDGKSLLDEGKFVDARPVVDKAIEMYDEPSFRLVMGDIHAKQGRINDARDEWVQAQKAVFGEIYFIPWLDPSIRLIEAYTKADRLVEAKQFLIDLIKIAPSDPISSVLWIQTNAAMARTNGLDLAEVSKVLTEYSEKLQPAFTQEMQTMISPQIATLHASIGQFEEAKAVVEKAIAQSPSDNVLLELLDIDQQYELGVAEAYSFDTTSLVLTSPSNALRHAYRLYVETEDIEPGLRIIEEGLSQADDGEYEWTLSRAKYLDKFDDPRAIDAWDQLQERYPDNIELLYLVVESNALREDIDAVNAVIDQIVAKTETSGQALPSRLRLAQAVAIFSASKTKASRDQAIEIVRAVVAKEQQNIAARNMLGRLLSAKPMPSLDDPDDTFEPDFPGAIDQYVTLARQLSGRAAQDYLLESVDLSIENNDTDSAKQYLREFDSRFRNEYSMLHEVALRFENLGEFDEAIDIYRRIYQGTVGGSHTNAGLSLANLYAFQGEPRLAQNLLGELRKSTELTSDQLFRMAALFEKVAMGEIGKELAANGESFGLDLLESKLVYAKYAQQFAADEYESALIELIEMDSSDESVWGLLIKHQLSSNRLEEAQDTVARAMILHPDSQDIQLLSMLARGGNERVSELFDENDGIRLEASMSVDAYMAAANSAPRDELVAMLTSMLSRFPDYPPIQKFALDNLSLFDFDAIEYAALAERAARYMPRDSSIMRIAVYANLRAEKLFAAREIAQLWRANSVDSSKSADVAMAWVMIQLEDFEDASGVLSRYIGDEPEVPNDELDAELIHAYSHAQLMTGEDPSITAGRLQPFVLDKNALSRGVWLNLIVGSEFVPRSLPTHQEAARWLEIFAANASPAELPEIANAWLMIMQRFDARVPAYAQHSLELFDSIDQATPDNPIILNGVARAYAALAQVTENESTRDTHLLSAIEKLDRADQLDPTNLVYLFQGASFAVEVGDLASAEEKYRTLISRNLSPSTFAASIMNNLAMLIERQSHDSDKLNEALSLSIQAIEILDVPPFWGTRGWVELGLNQHDHAQESFKHAIDLDPDSIEGWIGLAITQHQLGSAFAEEAAESFERVLELIKSGSASEEMLDRLRDQGDAQWATVLVE